MGRRDYAAEAADIEEAVARERARWAGRLADAVGANDIEIRPARVPGATTYAALTPEGEELLRRARAWQSGMRQRLGQADGLRRIQRAEERNSMASRRGHVLPDDGYADGGEPYTDEEMGIIEGRPDEGPDDWRRPPEGVILEGRPTPPLARDRATRSGEPVQDCFGEWHGESREGGPPGGRPNKAALDFERLVRLVVAESEGAKGSSTGR